MPWTVKDVDEHKKGLTPDQKKKWVKVANSVYKDCVDGGGSDKTCAPKAIRVANSKFGLEGGDNMKVPVSALQLLNPDCFAQVTNDGEEDKLDMVAYSGGIIKSHWYWGNLAIDIQGLRFPEKKYPILEDHMRSRKIAFAPKPSTDGNKLTITNAKFVDTEESNEFRKLSKEGFPYQSSIYAFPEVIEDVGEDITVDVNGYKFKGPGTIWRRAIFKEASVCVFGYDPNTHARAFSNEELELNVQSVSWDAPPEKSKTDSNKEVKEPMTLAELKEKDPEGYQKLMDEARSAAETALKDEFDKERQQLSSENKKLTERLDASDTKILDLEKKEEIRAERERKLVLQDQVDRIWEKELEGISEMQLSASARRKIRAHVTPTFKEDGSLDDEKFTEAVKAEIQEWVSDVAPAPRVKGEGFSRKRPDDAKPEEAKEDDEWVNDMKQLSGEAAESNAA